MITLPNIGQLASQYQNAQPFPHIVIRDAPDPITCPADRRRLSLNMYYFSDGRPEHEHNPEAHMSLWQTRKGVDADSDVAQKAIRE